MLFNPNSGQLVRVVFSKMTIPIINNYSRFFYSSIINAFLVSSNCKSIFDIRVNSPERMCHFQHCCIRCWLRNEIVKLNVSFVIMQCPRLLTFIKFKFFALSLSLIITTLNTLAFPLKFNRFTQIFNIQQYYYWMIIYFIISRTVIIFAKPCILYKYIAMSRYQNSSSK